MPRYVDWQWFLGLLSLSQRPPLLRPQTLMVHHQSSLGHHAQATWAWLTSNQNLIMTLICLTSFTGLTCFRIKSNKAHKTATCGLSLSPRYSLPCVHWVTPRYLQFFKNAMFSVTVQLFSVISFILLIWPTPGILWGPAQNLPSFPKASQNCWGCIVTLDFLAFWICPFLLVVLKKIFNVLFCASTLFISHNLFCFKIYFDCL